MRPRKSEGGGTTLVHWGPNCFCSASVSAKCPVPRTCLIFYSASTMSRATRLHCKPCQQMQGFAKLMATPACRSRTPGRHYNELTGYQPGNVRGTNPECEHGIQPQYEQSICCICLMRHQQVEKIQTTRLTSGGGM